MVKIPDQPRCEVRPVIGYDGYFVGRDGTVWSTRRNRSKPVVYYPINVHQPDEWSRYCRVFLRKERRAGKISTLYVHRLVLEAFVGPCPEGMVARHRNDRDTTNNHVSNLCWGTQQENIDDKMDHGTRIFGNQIPHAKLNPDAVREIRRRYADGEYQRDLAAAFGVCQTVISHVVLRKTWKEVDDEVPQPDPLDRYANTGEDASDFREAVS